MYIGLDFDGTVVKHDFPRIGGDIGAIPWLQEWQDAGALIILNTMRSGKYLADAVEFIERNEITLYGINKNPTQTRWTDSPKIYAHIYIDDAAFGTPLIAPLGERPYVDWSKVGPGVLSMIGLAEKEEIILPGDHRLN